MSARGQIPELTKICALLVCLGFSSGSAEAHAVDMRWRLFDQGTDALLAIADSDEPGDAFGLPFLHCKQRSGLITIEGDAKENIRAAMAEMIRSDQAPWISVTPDTNPETTTIDLSYSFMDGWRYRFALQSSHNMFERFRREGIIDFKFGKAQAHEEFQVGLDNVSKFLDLCAAR
ncbi:hypothetical protein QWJ07_18635 [Frankia sp. RB7]|nr:hypothetical protein [Frankia sp. RB7]